MARDFTDEQLREIALPPEQHALAALAHGDLPAVRRCLDDMAAGHAGLDALSLHALARKAGKLRQDVGEEEAMQTLERVGRQLMATWTSQWQAGDARGAIADLVAVFRHQVGAGLAPLTEDEERVTLCLSPCGSGGRVDRQRLAEKHPAAYGGWSDGVNSYCQGCKAQQRALNASLGFDAWTSEKRPDGACVLRFHKGAQHGQVLFTEAERSELTQTRVQRAREQLAQGKSNKTDIAPLLDGQRKEWMPWHDFAVVWLAHLYAAALEIGGQPYLDELLAQTYEPAFVAGFPRYASMDDGDLAREIARTWNYHCADFRLHEEDERFVFTLDPCGSGGRLLRGQMWRDMFHYGAPLSPLITEPQPINFMRRAAPSYCTHCAASNRAQLRGAADPSVPLFFVVDGHAQMAPGMPCRTYVYKHGANRGRVDAALFHQVGLSAPAHPNPSGDRA